MTLSAESLESQLKKAYTQGATDMRELAGELNKSSESKSLFERIFGKT
jgi:hypothetical protein